MTDSTAAATAFAEALAIHRDTVDEDGANVDTSALASATGCADRTGETPEAAMSRLIVRRPAVAFLLACLPCSAAAQWAPAWIGTGEHPESFHGTGARGLGIATDGTVFAGIDTVHHNRSFAGAMRFEGGGAFAWLHERQGDALGTTAASGMALLSSGRVAIVGEDVATGTVFVRVIDGASGELVWEHQSTSGRLLFDQRHDVQQIVESITGELLVRLADGGDYVVLRFDPEGKPLPSWRWPTANDQVIANDIAATPDGGAVVTGYGDHLTGYLTVRFDSDGDVVFDDIELGVSGSQIAPSYVRVDAEGSTIVVASPETQLGVPGAIAWKIDPTGKRSWTVELSDQSSLQDTFANGPIRLTPDGDVLVAVDSPYDARLRVLHLDGGDGSVVRVLQSSVKTGSRPTGLALADNGRIVAAGFGGSPGSGSQSRIVEFDVDGTQCHHGEAPGMTGAIIVTPAATGWYVLGTSAFLPSTGNDAIVQRFDAGAPCDDVFIDSFDRR